MHSYEKQEGNIYGLQNPVTEPPYATMSYTWGRYLQHEGTPASGIRISGIDWKTPDIQPKHFTALRLLQAICTVRDIGQVDYMWIDIACINTDKFGENGIDYEFSMQHEIFLDAAASFIWLSRTEHSYILHLAKVFNDSSSLDDVMTISALLQVMADPWFSSLWTLLEAAVRTDAVILSSGCRVTTLDREALDPALIENPETIRFTSETGEPVTLKLKASHKTLHGRDNAQSSATSQSFSLRHLIHLVKLMMGSVRLGDARDKFHDAVNKSGMLSFDRFNPLSLYGSAQHRHTISPGIRMRYVHNLVFGFEGLQVDDALVGVEGHFNTQLMHQYPVLSQLFIRQTPLQAGLAWGLTTECKIPDIQLFIACASSYISLFTLNVETSAQEGTKDHPFTVSFRGPTSEFKTMASQWLGNGVHPSQRLLGISFDQCVVSRRDGSVVEIATSAVFPTLSPGGYILSENSQRDCIGHVSCSLADLEARVLAMATGFGVLPGFGVGVGLIIIPQHHGVSHGDWQRVGLCFWAFEHREAKRVDETLGTEALNLLEGVWEWTEGRSVD